MKFLLVLLTTGLIDLATGFSSSQSSIARGPHDANPARGHRQRKSVSTIHVSVEPDISSSTKAGKQSKGSRKWTSKVAPKNNQKRPNEAKFFQLNKKITGADTAADVITLLASTPGALTKTAGGGELNSINFATAIHRIGRYLAYNQQDRAACLSDPKFALLMCSFAEAIAGVESSRSLSDVAKNPVSTSDSETQINFSIREKSNLVWALAKLKIVPPQSALPVHHSDDVIDDLIKTSIQLRTEIIRAQKTKGKGWITTLSLLTAKLMDAVAFQMLEIKLGPEVKSQEMVNMVWAFAAAQRHSVHLFDNIGSRLVSCLEEVPGTPYPQEFSNAMWAYATAGYTGNSQRHLLKLLGHYFETDSNWLSRFKPQEVSNTAWALSTLLSARRENGEVNNGTSEQEAEDLIVVKILRKVAQGMIDDCDNYKSQEISNTVWSFGTLGFGVGAEIAQKKNLNDFIILKSDDYNYDARLVDEMLAVMRVSIRDRLRVFKEQELNNLAHGCARINRCEPEIFAGIASEFARRKGRVTGQDIGSTLWSFATTKFFDEHAFEGMLSRLRMDAVQYWKPQEISNVLWAIGTAGITPKYPKAFDNSLIPPSERVSFEKARQDPFTLSLAAAAKEILHRPQEFKTQEIKDSLWGFSKAGVRHPLVFRSIAEYLVGKESDQVPQGRLHTGVGLDTFSSQEIANLLWAYAKQGQLASENSPTLNGRMGVYCSTAIDIGETLMKRLINAAAEAELTNFGDLSRCTTGDLSNTIWSMATLGCRHRGFMEAVEGQVLNRCRRYMSGKDQSPQTALGGQELANILWSLATLNMLRPEVLDAVEPYFEAQCTGNDGVSAKSISEYMNEQELGNLAWSCTVAGHYPPKLIRLVLRGLVGEGEEQKPTYMAEIHGERGGLSEHSIMSLLYLSYGHHVDGATKVDLKLPLNFPNGWGIGDLTQLADEDEESGVTLSLTTSKVQQAVSAAFTRVGFDHIEEHIVSMDSIENIQVDLLSLDLADPVSKIGIEVDGPSHFCHDLDYWTPQDPVKGNVRFLGGGQIEYTFDWNAKRNSPNGSTSMKNRILKRLGWTIVRVPFWEWYAMNGKKEAEDEYCRKILDQL